MRNKEVKGLIEQITTLVGTLGAIAFVVSVITQVLKGVKPFDKLPTDILVFILSIALTLVTFFAYASYAGLVILWYYVVGAVIAGFIVAFVAMYGWTKLKELWDRFKLGE